MILTMDMKYGKEFLNYKGWSWTGVSYYKGWSWTGFSLDKYQEIEYLNYINEKKKELRELKLKELLK